MKGRWAPNRNMITHKQSTTLERGVTASLHPETGNLRLSVSDGKTWHHYFFPDGGSAIEFLEGALDLVDPAGSEGDA